MGEDIKVRTSEKESLIGSSPVFQVFAKLTALQKLSYADLGEHY